MRSTPCAAYPPAGSPTPAGDGDFHAAATRRCVVSSWHRRGSDRERWRDLRAERHMPPERGEVRIAGHKHASSAPGRQCEQQVVLPVGARARAACQLARTMRRLLLHAAREPDPYGSSVLRCGGPQRPIIGRSVNPGLCISYTLRHDHHHGISSQAAVIAPITSSTLMPPPTPLSSAVQRFTTSRDSSPPPEMP